MGKGVWVLSDQNKDQVDHQKVINYPNIHYIRNDAEKAFKYRQPYSGIHGNQKLHHNFHLVGLFIT